MRKYWLAVLLGVTVLAAGCKSTTDTKNTAETTDAADSGETTDTTDAGALSDAGKSAYRSVLEDIYYNQQFPNGLELDYDGADMSQNQFGVYDVDGDGREELVISYVTASMAGNAFLVYDFVEALGAVREEFVEFPAVTFYDNGIVRADWSHNPSTAADSEFWPFTLYVYGEDEDSYVEIGSVYEGNEKGVYYQTLAGEDELEIDETVLEDWLSFCIQDSKELSIPMESLTEEHIKALR